MRLSLCFYDVSNDQPQEPIYRAIYTAAQFRELLDVGMFKIAHMQFAPGVRGIDLRIYRIKVEELILTCRIPHPEKRAIINAVRKHKYMVGNQ